MEKARPVRITDRGPFVDNRIIDLSYAAAKEIESVGPGVVPVRIEVISGPDPYSGFSRCRWERSRNAGTRSVERAIELELFPDSYSTSSFG